MIDETFNKRLERVVCSLTHLDQGRPLLRLFANGIDDGKEPDQRSWRFLDGEARRLARDLHVPSGPGDNGR